jgi:hypothetical protein
MKNELQEFIQETLKQIQAGTAGHTDMGDVDFETAITKSVKKDGSIDVKVVDMEGEWKTEHISKVKFSTRLYGAQNKREPSPWNARI